MAIKFSYQDIFKFIKQFINEYRKDSIFDLEKKGPEINKIIDNFKEFNPLFILLNGSFVNNNYYRDIDFVIVSNYFLKFNLIERLSLLSHKGNIYDPIPRTLNEFFISINKKDRLYYELKKGFYLICLN